jgi:hypothetical protein
MSSAPFLGVIGACLAWGTFTSFMKCPGVVAAKPSPLVFNFWGNLGMLLSTLPLLLFIRPAFTWWGVIASLPLVTANMVSFVVVKHIGVATGQGIWCGFVSVTSFLWGWLYFRHEPRSLALTLAGLGLQGLGVAGMSAAKTLSTKAAEPRDADGETASPSDLEASLVPALPAAPNPTAPNRTAPNRKGAGRGTAALPVADKRGGHPRSESVAVGSALAVLVGVLAGSILVPQQLAPARPFRDGLDSLSFCFSFSAGAVAYVVLLLAADAAARGALPDLEARRVAVPGMLYGALWSVGNMCSVVAVLPPLGLAIGYPLTQGALVVSGLMGVCFWGELRGRGPVGVFFISSAVLIAGSVLMGVFGRER